ncbi:MAG: NAD(P)H-dependent oxidoreductase [Candidatus Eremiobacteraeota bacterium]|nr:NAD(P)H-dependent oxidoreductase [Candidatus Eremiobacteraeota bacterium]
MSKPRILAFSGSLRKESFNSKLVLIAAAAAEEAGAEVTRLNLRDYPLPLYDGDIEASSGLPENALLLQAVFEKQDGFLISVPEYNSMMPGVLKNAIDWISRPVEGKSSLFAFSGKYATIMSASPGGLGGLRGLPIFRLLLSNLGVHVTPKQVAVSSAGSAFDPDGQLLDGGRHASIQELGRSLTQLLARLA